MVASCRQIRAALKGVLEGTPFKLLALEDGKPHAKATIQYGRRTVKVAVPKNLSPRAIENWRVCLQERVAQIERLKAARRV